MKPAPRPVQYFTDEYLEHCRSITVEQKLQWLDDMRAIVALGQAARAKSRLISLKVPQPLLDAFKTKARLQGVPYQTKIKTLMREWLEGKQTSDFSSTIHDR